MRSFSTLMLIVVLAISACSKNENLISSNNQDKVRDFSFVNKNGDIIGDSLTWTTYLSISVQNNDDTSLFNYKWKIGDADNNISDYTKTPSIIYNMPGTYIVKRYAYNKSNNDLVDSTSRTVFVANRTLKDIKIDLLDWTKVFGEVDIPADAKIDLFARIYKDVKNSNNDYIFNNAEVLMESDTLKNIANNTTNIIFESNNQRSLYMSINNSLHALYGIYNGKVYLLAADWFSGIGGSMSETYGPNNAYITSTYTTSTGSGIMAFDGVFDFTK
ncbi:hypothetical protein [Rhizosphaericola mali]|uniref:PKD domain-containing protein n=1 Tax=Rhizosphaericola mali TaxID=2545455 RepID=A0A5P2G9A5_9BACT|nr:hypothetical protein [Rhizosphaericola mali]QES90532.1 hypothetical protein E0W69_018335 [Rhizosphaericola mali]